MTINLWWVLAFLAGVGTYLAYARLPALKKRYDRALLLKDRKRYSVVGSFADGDWAPLSQHDRHSAPFIERAAFMRYLPEDRLLQVNIRLATESDTLRMLDRVMSAPEIHAEQARILARVLGPETFAALAGLTRRSERVFAAMGANPEAVERSPVREAEDVAPPDNEARQQATPQPVPPPRLSRNRRLDMGSDNGVN